MIKSTNTVYFPNPPPQKSTGLNVLIKETYLITYEISVHARRLKKPAQNIVFKDCYQNSAKCVQTIIYLSLPPQSPNKRVVFHEKLFFLIKEKETILNSAVYFFLCNSKK